jgi:hypothetical protein
MTPQRWGALASFLLALAFLAAPSILFDGCDTVWPTGYDLADLLYGPVWAASLVTVVFELRERIGESASRRMTLALLAATLSAGMIVAAAIFRSTNRHYHLRHPELSLQHSSFVLLEWTTRVEGMIATGRHFLGWSLVLLGSAGWTSRRLPRLLCLAYFAAGTASLFAYARPGPIDDFNGAPLAAVICIWQGIVLWKAETAAVSTLSGGTSDPPGEG